MRILSVIGARPQFVKAMMVSQRFRQPNSGIDEVLVHTGQHYDEAMSQIFFDELSLPRPDYNLAIGSGSHADMTGRMLEAIESVLFEQKPDWVLVYGDTNSTLAGGLAAAKLNIPVAHVEAGLRSYNRTMPEEINRVLTDHLSTSLFVPTQQAATNLEKEGISGAGVHLVGDVMVDVAKAIDARAGSDLAVLENLGVAPDAYILATIHRAENTDAEHRLRACVEGLLAVAADVPVVLPLHPRTRMALTALQLLDTVHDDLVLTAPAGYRDMVVLEKHARLVVTDSGGVQKEAYVHGTPCVTLRDETEWVELVDAGWNHLVSPSGGAVVAAEIRRVLQLPPPQNRPAFYGNGDAAEKIYRILSAGRHA